MLKRPVRPPAIESTPSAMIFKLFAVAGEQSEIEVLAESIQSIEDSETRPTIESSFFEESTTWQPG